MNDARRVKIITGESGALYAEYDENGLYALVKYEEWKRLFTIEETTTEGSTHMKHIQKAVATKPAKTVSEGIQELIEEVEANLQQVKIDNEILKERLKVIEFERDQWRKAAERPHRYEQ